MASKSAKTPFGGSHTAGIYADMTVDGPEIGTLVVIVDKAKNLPNRKTMGKQDPYCAARLGKEAKKTETDRRGGQTPRWDQELRFTVHESPDYYQLKVSVFNDDKRTELIGETRIGLEDIIIPGGGQNDTWHHLHCKGRFAGEIRIELTYYDTRPKEDKPPDRPVDSTADGMQEPNKDSVGGPRHPKPPKRRPLPANPVEVPRPGMPEHAHSSPLPQPTQPMIHQPTPSHPDPQGYREKWTESTPPSGNRHQPPQHSNSTGSPMGHGDHGRQWMNGNNSTLQEYDSHIEGNTFAQNAPMHMPAPYYPDRHAERYVHQHGPSQPQYEFQSNSGFRDPSLDAYEPNNRHASLPPSATYDWGQASADRMASAPPNDYTQLPPPMPHGHSMPDVRDPRFLGHQPQRHSLPGGREYTDSPPIQQYPLNDNSDPYLEQQQSMTDDDVPPPPPAHRTNSGTSASPLGHGRTHSENSASLDLIMPQRFIPKIRSKHMSEEQTDNQIDDRTGLLLQWSSHKLPQPPSELNERRGSSIPFGPDSYDAFNPFISSSSAGISPGARYETPEQAKEAAIQHEREKKLGDGPIIGSDGRVIDPSDHLPTDTWAPEPEIKAPKKTAQVNFRFRNSPQGAQPMPPSGRRPLHDSSARPASISTPTYSSTANNVSDNISPTTAARARLQKKSRMSPAQPNSSPIVPTVNTALQNPVLRSTASDYPLQEHENYGYGSSPTYSRHSPSGIPPPIPGKVPIAVGQEDWRRDPLSEELSRIDIGAGGGRMRRTKYGG
ncbi:MAG: hypothetical protein Q9213_006711 [Squamulea squamosa]